MYDSIEEFTEQVINRNPNEPEFHQAVQEVVESLWPVIEQNPDGDDVQLTKPIGVILGVYYDLDIANSTD